MRFAFVLLLALAAPQEVKRDPKAQELIDQMLAAYKAANSFHERVTVKAAPPPPELKAQWNGFESLDLKLQRPNRLRMEAVLRRAGEPERILIVCDGAWVWRWNGGTNTYSKSKASPSLDRLTDIPDHLPEIVMLLRGTDAFREMKVKDAEIPLAPGSPVKVGEDTFDVLQAGMNAEEAPLSATLRILAHQKTRLIQGIVLEIAGKNPATGKDLALKMEAVYEIVDPAPALSAADFRFVPPPGAKPSPSAARPR